MIQFGIDHCNCCDIPADQCEVVIGLVRRGVPPDLITHEILTPPLEDVINDGGGPRSPT